MKKDGILSKIVFWIFILPIVILMVLSLILYTPIDFIKYCLSNRRKYMKQFYGKQAKYNWLVTLTAHYKLYELISKSNLPIQFIHKGENPCADGYFYYNQMLFSIDLVPHFDPESGAWNVIGQGTDEAFLPEYVESFKEEFHKCTKSSTNVKCENVVFLVNEKDVYDEERDLANNTDYILTYNKKNFAEKINGFISKQS